jgi:hypothetical protein
MLSITRDIPPASSIFIIIEVPERGSPETMITGTSDREDELLKSDERSFMIVAVQAKKHGDAHLLDETSPMLPAVCVMVML